MFFFQGSKMLIEKFIPFIEIVIIAVMVNYILSFFWNTRTMDLMFGIVALLGIYLISAWLGFPILKQIMLLGANVAMIAILIVFQPELRYTLSKFSLKRRGFRGIRDFDRFLDDLSQSVYQLSERKAGALIVLENEHSMEEYIKSGVMLDAQFSPQLIETIFTSHSPLHDGAVVIRKRMIAAASAILPLTEDRSEITYMLGTRHRAALGLSQLTDAIVIVVSEETGRVSIARDGLITQGLKIERFKGIIRSIFAPVRKRRQSKFSLNVLRGNAT